MNVMAVIDKINKPNEATGDYHKDGLLYCGKCNMPKQCRGDGPLTGKILNIKCECAERAEEAEKAKAIADRNNELRCRCLPLERQRRSTFAQAKQSKAILIAENYVKHWLTMSADGTGLLFCGNVGTGKSYAALCIANALIDRGIAVKYYSAADIVSKLTSKELAQDYIKALCAAPLLIIDDLGAEHDSAYSQSQLCRAIDARVDSGRPFICTTNYSLEEMEKTTDHIKQRIFDRVKAVTVPVVVDGQSRRIAEGQKRLEKARQILQ